jgi:hypothetical protein
MMIWHICKKDLRLLWPLAVLGALLQAWTANFTFERTALLAELPFVFIMASLILTTVVGGSLVVIAVLQETPASLMQDWLVRPVPRAQLLAAKLLFVAIAIHAPMLAIDVMNGVRAGLPLAHGVAAALTRCAFLFLCVTLPLMGVAAFTKNLTATILWIIGIAAGVFIQIAIGLMPLNSRVPLAGSGMLWMLIYTLAGIPLAAALIVLPLLYFRRNVVLARRIAIGAAALFALSNFTPWEPAYALQKALSRRPDAAANLTIAFSPAAAPFKLPPQVNTRADLVVLFLPLRVEGLPPGAMLKPDRTMVRLLSADGTFVYEARATPETNGRANLRFNLTDVRQGAGGGAQDTYQLLFLPRELYARIKDQPLRLESEHAVTVLEPARALTLPVAGGAAYEAGIGHCRTTLRPGGKHVALRCLTGAPFGRPSCASLNTDHPAVALDPHRRLCEPDYTPAGMPFPFGAVGVFALEPEIHDLSEAKAFDLAKARLILESFKPAAHVVRTVTASNVRLSDWITE